MFRRILFRPLFLGSFVTFIAIFFVLSASTSESFNFFKVWTVNQNLKIWADFVKTSDVPTAIVWSVLAQLKIGNGTLYGRRTTSDTLGLEAHAQALVNTDILQLLREARDPSSVFDLHLAQTENLLQDMDATYASLMQTSQQKSEASQACLQEKQAGDQAFFVWVNDANEMAYQAWLDQSMEYAPCYITNRIEANAYAYLAQKSIAYQTILHQRNQTLQSNRELLLQSYPLLHGDVAQQLVSLKNTLNQVNKTTYTDFSEFFSFGFPQDGNLPSLQNVRFKDNSLAVPNYVDPLKGFGSEISAE